MVRGFYVFLQEQFWLNAQKDANFSSPSISTSRTGFKAYFLTYLDVWRGWCWMNEHHGASADGLLLLWRLASPSHSISALCQLSALYALSNALPNQFCMVNKSRDFATDCSRCWVRGCRASCPGCFCSTGKGHHPQVLVTTALWEVTALTFTSWATLVEMN